MRNWAQFDRHIRSAGTRLLEKLPRYPDAILVAGCQRSGTTAVTRILRDAVGMTGTTFTKDDELDAALILAGALSYEAGRRCCFQTTYLNDHFPEYFEHDSYRLIWIIREPEAVVRSMLFNWRRSALNRLFRACGRHALDDVSARRFERFGTLGFGRAEMACLSYNVKTSQIHEIASHLGPERLYILDYDDLIRRRDTLLPDVFAFASVPYDDSFLARLHKRNKPGARQLSEPVQARIRESCDPEYMRALELARKWRPVQ